MNGYTLSKSEVQDLQIAHFAWIRHEEPTPSFRPALQDMKG